MCFPLCQSSSSSSTTCKVGSVCGDGGGVGGVVPHNNKHTTDRPTDRPNSSSISLSLSLSLPILSTLPSFFFSPLSPPLLLSTLPSSPHSPLSLPASTTFSLLHVTATEKIPLPRQMQQIGCQTKNVHSRHSDGDKCADDHALTRQSAFRSSVASVVTPGQRTARPNPPYTVTQYPASGNQLPLQVIQAGARPPARRLKHQASSDSWLRLSSSCPETEHHLRQSSGARSTAKRRPRPGTGR